MGVRVGEAGYEPAASVDGRLRSGACSTPMFVRSLCDHSHMATNLMIDPELLERSRGYDYKAERGRD